MKMNRITLSSTCKFLKSSLLKSLPVLGVFVVHGFMMESRAQLLDERFGDNELTAYLTPNWIRKDLDGDKSIWRRGIVDKTKYVAISTSKATNPDNLLSSSKSFVIDNSNNILSWTVGSGIDANGKTYHFKLNSTDSTLNEFVLKESTIKAGVS